MFRRFFQYFLEGVLALAPLGLTVYVVGRVLALLESAGERLLFTGIPRVPGLGVIIAVLLITLVGFVAGHWAVKWLFAFLERTVNRIPLVKGVYGSIKDVVDAFGGKKQSFAKVALVRMPGSPLEFLGFITREELDFLGAEGRERVSVYIPQSLQLGGVVAVVPRQYVTILETPPQVALRFLMTAGMTEGTTQGTEDKARIGGQNR